MTHSTALEYEAPWPVYGLDWCKTWTPGQPRARHAFRMAISSYTEDYRNRIAVIGLQDERALVDDEIHEGYSDFVVLAETMHGYPATKLQWQPSSAASFNWAMKPPGVELLATTGDALRIWDLTYDGSEQKATNYVGRHQTSTGYHLAQRVALSGSKAPTSTSGPPLTSFSWNSVQPSHIVTSSIDTTCTVWDINTSSAITQLIAHDREVYDVAWLPNSTDVFTSVGADGSLRLFDLRSLEHSTILYEASTVRAKESKSTSPQNRPMSTPLLRIAFNPADSHYIATFHMDSQEVQILDMRSPGAPVIEIKGHKAQVNAIGWSRHDSMLATAGDDCQVLVWDLTSQGVASPRHPQSSSRLPSSPRPEKRKVMTEPTLAYTAQGEINNIAWSPQLPQMSAAPGAVIPGGEWLALAIGKTVKVLKA